MIRSWFMIESIVVRRRSTGSGSLGASSGLLGRQWKCSDQGPSEGDREKSRRKFESIRLAAGPPLDDVV